MININIRIIALLEAEGIKDEGLLYLLSVFFDIHKDFNEYVVNKVNSLKIFEKDIKDNIIKWNLPLFADSIGNDFVERYRDLFRKIDIKYAGDRITITNKLKVFYTKYPVYSHKQILEATELYLDDCVSNGIYIQSANYFIRKERNPEGSKLLQWLEILEEEKEKEKLYDRG